MFFSLNRSRYSIQDLIEIDFKTQNAMRKELHDE